MSGYLLDTQVLYRWLRHERRLGRKTSRILAREDCAVSTVSLWEMVIKNAHGKLPLPEAPVGDEVEAQGFRLVDLTAAHVHACHRLEHSLTDPFDRLLLSVAAVEQRSLLTLDTAILELATRQRLPVTDATA